MIDFDVTVHATEFRERLARLKEEVRLKIVDSALKSAGQVLRKAVIARAPVLKEETKSRVPGTLQKAIYLSRSKRTTSGARRYYIGVRSGARASKSGRDAFYWRFLEKGWMPRGRGRKLKGGDRTRALQRSRNAQAGHRTVKYPFLQPAFDAAKDDAMQRFRQSFERALKKAEKQK